MRKAIFFLLPLLLLGAGCAKQTASNESSKTTGAEENAAVSQNAQVEITQNQDETGETKEPVAPEKPTATETPKKAEAVMVSMTKAGFSPSTVTVKAGTTVTFVNNDTVPHWVASDPHPSHTGLPGFDPKKPIFPGQSFSFTFSKLGSWGYHDHLNPSVTGTVIVE